MKVELKNVKIAKHLSQETTAFTASVYVDGVRVGEASNGGHGGQTHVDVPRPVYLQLEAFAKTLPEVADFGPAPSLIDYLVMRHELAAEAKRMCKDSLLFIANGEMWGRSIKGLPPAVVESKRAAAEKLGTVFLTERQVFEKLCTDNKLPAWAAQFE